MLIVQRTEDVLYFLRGIEEIPTSVGVMSYRDGPVKRGRLTAVLK